MFKLLNKFILFRSFAFKLLNKSILFRSFAFKLLNKSVLFRSFALKLLNKSNLFRSFGPKEDERGIHLHRLAVFQRDTCFLHKVFWIFMYRRSNEL